MPAGTAKGVVVGAVEPGSAARRAGLRAGDLIEEVNRERIEDVDAFEEAMAEARLRDGILFRIRRGELSSFVLLKSQR